MIYYIEQFNPLYMAWVKTATAKNKEEAIKKLDSIYFRVKRLGTVSLRARQDKTILAQRIYE